MALSNVMPSAFLRIIEVIVDWTPSSICMVWTDSSPFGLS